MAMCGSMMMIWKRYGMQSMNVHVEMILLLTFSTSCVTWGTIITYLYCNRDWENESEILEWD